MGRHELAVWYLLGFGLTWLVGGTAAIADSCAMRAVAVDTSQADPGSVLGLRCGEAGGQTFVAADTLIRSVAVWRPAVQTPYGGHLKLWITEVDSAGVPQLDRKILDGPVITVPFGDGIHPIKMEWSFDPPFALPHGGSYYFAVQDWCGGHWDLVGSNSDPYPGGNAWRSGIVCFDPEGCQLYRPPYRFSSIDLAFTIEFCRTDVTPVLPGSWGRLKVMYR